MSFVAYFSFDHYTPSVIDFQLQSEPPLTVSPYIYLIEAALFRIFNSAHQLLHKNSIVTPNVTSAVSNNRVRII